MAHICPKIAGSVSAPCQRFWLWLELLILHDFRGKNICDLNLVCLWRFDALRIQQIAAYGSDVDIHKQVNRMAAAHGQSHVLCKKQKKLVRCGK